MKLKCKFIDCKFNRKNRCKCENVFLNCYGQCSSWEPGKVLSKKGFKSWYAEVVSDMKWLMNVWNEAKHDWEEDTVYVNIEDLK